MRKTITLFACITLIGTISIVTSCKKKPEVQNAGGEVSQAPADDVVSKEEPKVELCVDGNCPCGDGFCAKNSVCIKDKCFCGAFIEKGFIDEYSVVSNSFGEFECARFISSEECTIWETDYDFICTRTEGCKIKDGPNFRFIDLSGYNSFNGMYLISESPALFYEDFGKFSFESDSEMSDSEMSDSEMSDSEMSDSEMSDSEMSDSEMSDSDSKIDDRLRIPSRNVKPDIVEIDRDKFYFYESLLKEHHINNCGKSLPDKLKYWIRPDLSILHPDLKYMDYRELSDELYCDIDNGELYCNPGYDEVPGDRQYQNVEDFQLPLDLECDLRKSCNDSGVTSEHINEYVCEIGKKYYDKLCETTKRSRPIGLRCIRPEGCICGDTHCPENSLCKDGTCTYDIYYENHMCPNKGWNASESDIENYKKTAKRCSCPEGYKYNLYCYNECWFHGSADNDEICKEACGYDEDEEMAITLACYEMCYWNDYDSTITKTDPCKTSQ